MTALGIKIDTITNLLRLKKGKAKNYIKIAIVLMKKIKSMARKLRHESTRVEIPPKIVKLLESFHGKAVHAGDIAPVIRAYCPLISNVIKFEQLNSTSARELLNTIRMTKNILSTEPWCHIRT